MEKCFGITFAILFAVSLIVSGIPIDNQEAPAQISDDNGTHKELYVIKATTYEIGLLVDVPNNDTTLENGTVTRQQVDVSFFDAESNDTFINLGDVPLPVQTNVSGQIITGIAPVHIGAVQNIGQVLQSLPFSGTIINITESDTSYIHVNRENVTQQDQQFSYDSQADLSKLPILNNVLLPDSFNEAYNSVAVPEEAHEDEDTKDKDPKF